MAYFNHSFGKCFLGNGPTVTSPANTNQGFITDSGVNTADLATFGAGYYGFFDSAYESVAIGNLTAGECCPLTLAAASIKANDKQGPFHGGYQESNKSKLINPKFVRQWYGVAPNAPQQNIVHVGSTYYTDTLGDPSCVIPFYCDETYYLRIDIKGSPALRFANHNMYQTLQADGGCCDPNNPAVTEVDSTLIMLQWAQAIVENPYFKDFIKPIVIDEAGHAWYATAADAVAGGVPATQIFENYVSPGHTPGDMAGLVLIGAYVDTTFEDCTFQITDHYEREPIRILASLVDYNGDPCVFEGVCVHEECPALQVMGTGEQAVRDLIMSESYLQNFFHSDLRIREITQGDQTLAALNRSTLVYRYYMLHSVPRYNNPTGTFDNDQYMLEIIESAKNADLEAFVNQWLTNCGDECTTFVEHMADTCTALVPPTTTP